MKKYLSNKRGFTLVELMVVVAIIGILSAVVITSISSSRGKARDARRVSDIAQIQLALEQFFDKCGQYPDGLDLNSQCPTNNNILLSNFISVIPKDPSFNTNYGYEHDINKVDYALRAQLEYQNSATEGSLESGIYGLTCDGNLNYCIGPK